MIDIKELRKDKRPQSAWVVHTLIDRLEAAEKSDAESIAMYRKARDERDALRVENAALVDDMNLLRNNNTDLRAKIAEMERQEPVATVIKEGDSRYWMSERL